MPKMTDYVALWEIGLIGTLNHYLCDGFTHASSGIDGLSKIDGIMRLS